LVAITPLGIQQRAASAKIGKRDFIEGVGDCSGCMVTLLNLPDPTLRDREAKRVREMTTPTVRRSDQPTGARDRPIRLVRQIRSF
jgi:hypothetical protein